MNVRALVAGALLAFASAAATAQPQFQIEFRADQNAYAIGEVMFWSVWATGDFDSNDYVFGYDLDIIASSPDAGTASIFFDSLDPVLNPTGGIPSGASLFSVTGGQSSIVNPLAIQYGEVQLGTFRVTAQEPAILSYTAEDGGVLSSFNMLRIADGSDIGPPLFNGQPNIISDTVFIGGVPTPGAGVTLTAWLAVGARRTRRHA